MTAAKYDLQIEQGATLDPVIAYTDPAGGVVDLTGYTARMQIRQKVSSETPVMTLTTENGGIVIGSLTGTISLNGAASLTAALPGDFRGVYDLELVTGAIVKRLIEGAITVSPQVTR